MMQKQSTHWGYHPGSNATKSLFSQIWFTNIPPVPRLLITHLGFPVAFFRNSPTCSTSSNRCWSCPCPSLKHSSEPSSAESKGVADTKQAFKSILKLQPSIPSRRPACEPLHLSVSVIVLDIVVGIILPGTKWKWMSVKCLPSEAKCKSHWDVNSYRVKSTLCYYLHDNTWKSTDIFPIPSPHQRTKLWKK